MNYQQEHIMNKIIFVLLSCSALLTACDDANNNTSEGEASLLDKANSLTSDSDETTKAVDSLMESAKESASGAMDAAKEAASDAMASGKDLKDTAVESASAAYESAKESVGETVDNTINTSKEISSAAVAKTSDVIASVCGDDMKQGESIYKKSCNACHGTGVAGSPKLGDTAAWETRIAKGNAILSQHAIEGFKGETGYMPAKGGSMNLSDDDVSLAVEYMVSQSQ